MPKRKNFHFVVRVPGVEGLTKRDAQNYVREACRGWAGGGHVEDPLYHHSHKIVVKGTLYEMERETLMNLRKDLSRVLAAHEKFSGEHAEVVDGLLLNYLGRV